MVESSAMTSSAGGLGTSLHAQLPKRRLGKFLPPMELDDNAVILFEVAAEQVARFSIFFFKLYKFVDAFVWL